MYQSLHGIYTAPFDVQRRLKVNRKLGTDATSVITRDIAKRKRCSVGKLGARVCAVCLTAN
ncbi:diguanylate cyclase [Anopheles sinensis]|uniref:Diguanylate cyclase n=1 Tax=Anopheles sinensis TaxID=74873 RepID=A0A084WUV7_ANOSI|nr:diguanylate cyclase [Anopheles sinensis]